MNYDTDNSGVIDLVRLIADVLELRSAAMLIAIDERDVELADALNNGIDAEIHRLLGVQLKLAKERAETARTTAFETPGTLYELAKNVAVFAHADQHAQAIEGLYAAYGDAVQAMKGLHPLLFEQTTPELLRLLMQREEREHEKVEADKEATASANATS